MAELLGVDMPSFESLNRKALKDLKRDFSAYVKKVKAAAGLASDEMAADTVFLKYDEAGYPSIVGFKAGDVIPKKRLEELLRRYLRRHYCEHRPRYILKRKIYHVNYLDLASGGKGEGERSPSTCPRV